MKQDELESMYLNTKHGTFTPLYTFKDFVLNKETNEYEYEGLVIIKTADKVYQEYLITQEQEDKISILQGQLAALEDENMVLSEYGLGLEMKSLEQEEAVTMTNEYVLDLDIRLTNIETK